MRKHKNKIEINCDVNTKLGNDTGGHETAKYVRLQFYI